MSRIVFQIKITQGIKAALTGLAAKANRSTANYAETLLKDAIERETGEPVPCDESPPEPKRGVVRRRKTTGVQP